MKEYEFIENSCDIEIFISKNRTLTLSYSAAAGFSLKF